MAHRRSLGLSTELPSSPAGGEPGAVPRRPRVPAAALRAEAWTALRCAVGVVLLGAPVGLLWRALATRPQIARTAAGGVDLVDSETEAYLRGDATLLLLGVAAGVLVAVLGWRLARRRPVGALLGLVGGAALAAWVASRTGTLGQGTVAAAVAAARGGSGAVDLPLRLRAHAVLLGWPAATAVTYVVLALRRPAEPAAVSSG